ncbi:MAG: Lrp/AsnC family transcriptional regulator [Desulfovibrionaceae bacterium]
MKEFTEIQVEILRRVQGTLPDSATPYADIAAQVGCTEAEVLDLLRAMKADGSIRRFGATLRHQKAGYGANAMVAWNVQPEEKLLELGKQFAKNRAVSHCYWRREQPTWPYNLYTMVHGKSPEDCEKAVQEMVEATGVTDYTVLFSIKELKKTSMTYF